MSAGRLVPVPYAPARDRYNRLVPGARITVWGNRTTTKAAIFADAEMSTPLANPITANSSGLFPAIWAEGGTVESPLFYSWSITDADGASIGNPNTFDDWALAFDADQALAAIVTAAANSAAESASTASEAAAESNSARDEIMDVVENAPDAPSVVNKANRDGGNIADEAGWRSKLGLGDAATRNVGSANGTVAAGDDERIVAVANKANKNGSNAEPEAFRSAIQAVGVADLASSTGLNLVGDGTNIVLGSGALKADVPQGNPYQATRTKLSIKVYGDDPAISGQEVRGFAFMSGVDNRGQAGQDNVSGDLVAGYFGATGSPFTTGDSETNRQPIWALNALAEMRPNSGTYNARVAEFDFNNGLRDIGAGDGPLYTNEVIACGLEVYNSGEHSTAGVLVNVGSDGSSPYYRGFAVAPGAAAQAGFADYSDASYSFDSRGNHAFGLFLEGAYSEAAIRVPNGAKIAAKTTGGGTGNLFRLNASNQIVIGEAGVVTDAVSECSIFPSTDNSKQFGAGEARWSSIWAANGTIQTSDPDLKSNVLPISNFDFGAVIDAISPISWVWTVGGKVEQEVDDVRPVQAVETETTEETFVEMVDGRAVQVTRPVTRERRLFDEIPVFDEDGQPVMEKRRVFEFESDGSIKKTIVLTPRLDSSGAAILGADGEPVLERVEIPVSKTVERQKTVSVPRMVEVPCRRRVYVDRPGQRRHWGFDASQIAKVKDLLGEDFAGYVEDENGVRHIRPDQLIPFVWAEVRSLRQRVADLEERDH